MVATERQDLFLKVFSTLNEAQTRRFAGLRALEIGWGGISQVSELTGLTYNPKREYEKELTTLKTKKQLKKKGYENLVEDGKVSKR